MNYKHGLAGTPAYLVWKHMMGRCYGKHYKGAENYKRRGIKVCESWHNPINFVADMGSPPKNMQLDRIDNKKDYSKENCRWATRIQQANNTSVNNFYVFEGKRLTAYQWARLLVYPRFRKLFRDRLDRGWTFLESINTLPFTLSKKGKGKSKARTRSLGEILRERKDKNLIGA